MEELLEKIPVEKRWTLTSKFLTTFIAWRGEKAVAPELGKGEGIIAPVLGAAKWREITSKTFLAGLSQFSLWMKETFNIPVEDAIGAAKFFTVMVTLAFGPELELEIVEATPERTVVRYAKCPWWERWKDLEIDLELLSCHSSDWPVHQLCIDEVFKAINPRITGTLTKQLSKGDPCCEDVYEFKEE
jgi:hypothetical protein